MRLVLPVGATLLSAVLMALAFPPARWQLAAFVCLAPYLIALRSVGRRAALGLGLLFGIVFPLGVCAALPSSTGRYFAQSGAMSWLFAGSVIAFTGTVYYVAFVPVYRLLCRRPGPALPLLTAAAWVTLELARGRLLTGSAFWGNEWALIGYSQVGRDALLQVASLGGIYAVGFVVVAFNAALAELWLAHSNPARLRRVAPGALLALLPVVVAQLHGSRVLAEADAQPPATPGVRVAIVQPDIDLGSQWRREFYGRNLDEQLALTREVVERTGAELVVWPELALTFHVEAEPALVGRIQGLLQELGLQLVTGGPSVAGDAHFNSVFVLDAAGIQGRYDKERLVPFTEFLPFQGVDPARRGFDGARSFAAGNPVAPPPSRAGPAGVLVCNEGMMGALARQRAADGATWLVSPSNDSWITGDAWADLTFDIVAVRAVELGRYLVRASSSGPSGIVDPWGRVLVRTPPASRALVAGEIWPRSEATAYARLGDVFGGLCVAAVGVGLLAAWRRPERPSEGG